jgi:hypothetical protein
MIIMILRKSKNVGLRITIALFAAALTNAGIGAEPDSQSAQLVAAQSLPTLEKLAATGTNSGFASPSEVKAASLGEGIRSFMVRLDELRNYDGSQNANALLKPLDKIIFPVSVAQTVRSSIVVEKVRDKWKATGFGGAILTKALVNEKKRSSAETRLPTTDYFSVDVPALNGHFLGYRQGGKLMLISVFDDSKLGFKSGDTLNAEEVFTRLAPIAKQYNGLPL